MEIDKTNISSAIIWQKQLSNKIDLKVLTGSCQFDIYLELLSKQNPGGR